MMSSEKKSGCILFLIAVLLCPVIIMFHGWVIKEIYEHTLLPCFPILPKLDLLFFVGIVLVHSVFFSAQTTRISETLQEVKRGRRGIVFLESAIKTIAEKFDVDIHGSGPEVEKEPTLAESFAQVLSKECSVMLTELAYVAMAWGFAAILL